MAKSKYNIGYLMASKNTLGHFDINVENENFDLVCKVQVDPASYAFCLVGKQVKADVFIDGVNFEGKKGGLAFTPSTEGVFYLEVLLPNGNEFCQCLLTPEEFAHVVSGENKKVKLRVYKNPF